MSRPSKSRNTKAARLKNEENKYIKPETLTLEEVQCTVCMGIFIEPVTLPCYHSVCKICFEKTIDNNSLACPLCRKYVGGWVRQRQKKDLLVNKSLWSYICEHFDTHVQKKLSGEDDEVIDALAALNLPAPKLCEPGVIRQEYEAEQKRLQQEALKRQQLEVQASEKLIKELQEREEEEQRHLEELRRKAEEEDALLAQRFAAQLQAEEAQKQAEEEANFKLLIEQEQASSAFVQVGSQDASTPRSQSLKKGPMDIFLSQRKMEKLKRAGSSSSTDSLNSELHHFRPVHLVPRTPPKTSPDGSRNDAGRVCKPVPVMRSLDGWSSVGSSTLRPWILNHRSIPQPSNSGVELHGPIDSSLFKGEKRERSPSDVSGKSPKKSRRESPRKNAKLKVPLQEKKVNLEDNTFLESDLESDFGNNQGLSNGFGHSLHEKSVHGKAKNSIKQKTMNNFSDIDKASIQLSLHDLQHLSDPVSLENRCRQEQDDYEFAMKLQKELNAMESQSRSYELRSVVSLTPKKKTSTNVSTPKTKSKAKPDTSASKKEKRRQCTLEESINFSVKMKL